MSDFKKSIFVPGKPISKSRPRFTKQGYTYTDKKTFNHEKTVRTMGKAIMKGDPPTKDQLELDIAFVFEKPKSWSLKKRTEKLGTPHGVRPDLDNLVKIIDALNNVVFEDDCQVARITALKMWGEENGTFLQIQSAE